MATRRFQKYDPDAAVLLCERLAEGRMIKDVCADEDMPSRPTVRAWLMRALNPEDHRVPAEFSAMYARAREDGWFEIAEQIIEIAYDGTNDWVERVIKKRKVILFDKEHVQRSKLRVEARKWMRSKMLPKVYGDAKRLEIGGPDGKPVEVTLADLVRGSGDHEKNGKAS